MAADKKPSADANKPSGASGKDQPTKPTAPSTSKDAASSGKDTGVPPKPNNEKKPAVDTEDLVKGQNTHFSWFSLVSTNYYVAFSERRGQTIKR